jgi:hypothetical protein
VFGRFLLRLQADVNGCEVAAVDNRQSARYLPNKAKDHKGTVSKNVLAVFSLLFKLSYLPIFSVVM